MHAVYDPNLILGLERRQKVIRWMKVVDRASPKGKQRVHRIVECPGEIFRSQVAMERASPNVLR